VDVREEGRLGRGGADESVVEVAVEGETEAARIEGVSTQAHRRGEAGAGEPKRRWNWRRGNVYPDLPAAVVAAPGCSQGLGGDAMIED
jgi:hypothetical protein